jgi:hypothetical protein
MAIRFSCACGKEMQAREEYAGRRTKCPACGAELVIPGRSSAIKPLVEERAAGRLARNDEDDDDRLADRPRRKAGRVEEGEEESPARKAAPKTSFKAILCLILGLLAFGCNFLAAIPAVILGLLSLRDVHAGKGLVTGKGLAITGIVMSVFGLFCNDGGIGGGWFALFKVRDAAQKTASANNLKQIGLAMHEFNGKYDRFPAVAIQKDGRPLLSWRVALLPYLGENNLYNQFKRDEPWDSLHNKRLLTPMPKVFACPGADAATAAGKTHYRAFYGTGAFFDPAVTLPGQRGDPTLGIRLPDISDGMSNTIVAVEAAEPVEWTKPDDLRFDPNALMPKLGVSEDGFNVLLADGTVRYLKKPADERQLKAAITRNGGEIVVWP